MQRGIFKNPETRNIKRLVRLRVILLNRHTHLSIHPPCDLSDGLSSSTVLLEMHLLQTASETQTCRGDDLSYLSKGFSTTDASQEHAPHCRIPVTRKVAWLWNHCLHVDCLMDGAGREKGDGLPGGRP